MPCLLYPLAKLPPPFSLTLKVNPIDDPSTIMNLLRTPLHTTWPYCVNVMLQYMTCCLIKVKIGYQTPEWPTWDQEGTQSMFSMMTRYDVRDVGRKGISLGIVTENINMMGSNKSQLLGKRIWWNRHMLLTGTTINKNTQDFKQDHSGPSQKNYDSPPLQIPFSCHLSSTNASSPITQWYMEKATIPNLPLATCCVFNSSKFQDLPKSSILL